MCAKFKTLENLPPRIKTWLTENEWEQGAHVFLTNAGVRIPKSEKINREKALCLAIMWYDYDEQIEKSEKIMPPEIHAYLSEIIKPNAIHKENPDDDTEHDKLEFWYSMCQHAAEYAYAGIESTHKFHRALWGALRTLMDEEKILEIVDLPIKEALKKGFENNNPGIEGLPAYGIKLKGLNSELIFLPPHARTWIEHADMFITQVVVSSSS
jgi:hypothetical protein